MRILTYILNVFVGKIPDQRRQLVGKLVVMVYLICKYTHIMIILGREHVIIKLTEIVNLIIRLPHKI